jgi:chromosome partitioning protein
MSIADLVLVPCRPNPADIWALADTVDAIRRVQEIRPDLPAHLLINGSDRRTALSRDARDNIGTADLPILDTQLDHRVAFAEAVAVGQGITTYAPKSPAASELRKLADEIEFLVTGEKPERAGAAKKNTTATKKARAHA